MAIYADLKTALRNVSLVANAEYPTMPVIFSHQNGPEPAESYLTISILSQEQQGRHSTATLTNEDKELSVKASYEVLVQFSFFGSLSGDAANEFIHKINNNPRTLEELTKNKLGVMRKTSLRRSPQKRDTQWIEAFNLDVTFNYILNTDQLVDVVDAVLLEDVYSGDTFTIPPNFPITP